MVEPLGDIILKSRERVQAAAIRGPDEQWRAQITRLLGHKGDIWRWQNSELLNHDTGIEPWFYVLHRDGRPFAHVMTAELNGVGIFGHVWTEPADRGQGASGRLIDQQMMHFRRRGGRALYLNTSPDNPAFALYQRQGFAAIEPGSGAMDFVPEGRAKFAADWFAPGPVQIEPVHWRHWPTAPALFMADIPGVARCVPLGLFGRMTSEEALLPWIQGANGRQVFVACKSNGAVVGVAAWNRDPIHAAEVCVDVFCHPQFWTAAAPLLDEVLGRAPATRRLAYADPNWPEKRAALVAAGFRPGATPPATSAKFDAARPLASLIQFEQHRQSG